MTLPPTRYFSLYDPTSKQFVSEPYAVKVSKHVVGEASVVFSDVPSTSSTLYLVAYVNRVGPIEDRKIKLDMNLVRSATVRGGSKSKVTGDGEHERGFRRPVACGVIDVTQFLDGPDDKEYEVQIPLHGCREKPDDDHFASLHQKIISNENHYYGNTTKHLDCSVQVLNGPLSEALRNISLGVQREPSEAKKRGYPDLIIPEHVRNDLYVTIDRADFDKGTKKSERNIEVTMQVLLEDGTALDCISIGSGQAPTNRYTSTVFYHSNKPQWAETVKVNIEDHLYERAHLLFIFKHCSTSEKEAKDHQFYYGFKKLVPNTSALGLLPDGEHKLEVFKYDLKGKPGNQVSYLVKPPAPASKAEYFVISTLACITKRTHNELLGRLIHFERSKAAPDEVLAGFNKIPGREIFKFIPKTFGSLFKILDEHPSEIHGQAVFKAIVHVANELTSPQLSLYRPLFAAYIDTQFVSRRAHEFLLPLLERFINTDVYVSQPSGEGSLSSCVMVAVGYLLRFIVRSWEQSQRATGMPANPVERSRFASKLEGVTSAFSKLVSKADPGLEPVQSAAVQYFTSAFDCMAPVFAPQPLGKLAAGFISAIRFNDKGARQRRSKLISIQSLAAGSLFATAAGRADLMPIVLQIIVDNVTKEDQEGQLTLNIAGDLLSALQASESEKSSPDIGKATKCMLPLLIEMIDPAKPKPSRYQHQLVLSNLLAVLELMTQQHWRAYMDVLQEQDRLHFIRKVIVVFRALVTQGVFPSDWTVMIMLQNTVIERSLQYILPQMEADFLGSGGDNGNGFQFKLWHDLFALGSAFIGQPSLQLESFSKRKRAVMLAEQHGDLRVVMAKLVAKMWRSLGEEQKVKCVLEKPVIDLSDASVSGYHEKLLKLLQAAAMCPETQVQEILIPIFFDMMETEVKKKGNFDIVTNDIIDAVDDCVTAGMGDEGYPYVFNEIMKKLVAESGDSYVREHGDRLISDMRKLLERLLALRDVGEDEAFDDHRAGCLYNMLKYYKDNDRGSLALRYVYKLCDIHVRSKSYIEAGYTLKLHADEIGWGTKMLDPFFDGNINYDCVFFQEFLCSASLTSRLCVRSIIGEGRSKTERYPAQKERERKEQIYTKIFEYFDMGQSWETAIPLAEELAEIYKQDTFEYGKLSALHGQISEFYQKIMSGKRTAHKYYQVGYYGGHATVPVEFLNKAFVYRGRENEQIREFCDRIQAQFPKAKLVVKATTPTKEMRYDALSQVIMVNTMLTPSPDPKMLDKFKEANKSISEFYRTNGVNTFT